jgi:hypothetical protein
MQQTKLFIYKLFPKVLFPCENQGVTHTSFVGH